jgi:hypothetical protein
VKVRVRASEQPAILVLTANEPVDWLIDAEEGALITEIILGGYYAQSVSGNGIEAVPISGYFFKDRQRKAYFYAYERGGKNYEKLEGEVRRLTGRPITAFQGQYAFDDKPGSEFVISPGSEDNRDNPRTRDNAKESRPLSSDPFPG